MSAFAYLFPGQGAQFTGMGREVHDAFAESRAAFAEADAALDMRLSELCFEGPDERLSMTETTQPAILTVSVAVLRALEARGLEPRAAAGHSLGEYSAHVAAGTLGFADAVRIVRQRGRFMQEAVPPGVGAMAAVLGMTPADVGAACERAAGDEVVAPANLNGPAQVVIAGHAAAVERASNEAREAGARRVVPLAVSAPFHCELMRPAADRLEPVLRDARFADPRFPVYGNVEALPLGSGETARDALLRQVCAPVRWQQTIETMIADGIETFVEVGPGKVLAGLVRGVNRRFPVLSVGTPDDVEAAVAALRG